MKAVVLEVRGREAAILMMDGTVRRVRGRYRVGQEINYFMAGRPGVRQWAAAVVAAILLLGGSAGMWIDHNYIAYAEVSLDVNPSIAYTVNRRNRVLSVRAVNDDASDIVSALQSEGVRFDALSDAVARTMTLLEDRGYLDSDAEDYVLANVSADDEKMQDALVEQVTDAFTQARRSDPTMEYRIDRADRVTAREAENRGMSVGRYSAWKQAGDDRKPEEFARMPVRQIIGAETDAQPGPDQSEPEQSAPDGSAPDQSAPDQSAPERSESVQSQPGQAPEKQSAPEQTAPGKASQEKSSFGKTAPEQIPSEQTEARPSGEQPPEQPPEARPDDQADGKADEKPGDRPEDKPDAQPESPARTQRDAQDKPDAPNRPEDSGPQHGEQGGQAPSDDGGKS